MSFRLCITVVISILVQNRTSIQAKGGLKDVKRGHPLVQLDTDSFASKGSEPPRMTESMYILNQRGPISKSKVQVVPYSVAPVERETVSEPVNSSVSIIRRSLNRRPGHALPITSVPNLIIRYNSRVELNSLSKEKDPYFLVLYTVLCEVSTGVGEFSPGKTCTPIIQGSEIYNRAITVIKRMIIDAEAKHFRTPANPHQPRRMDYVLSRADSLDFRLDVENLARVAPAPLESKLSLSSKAPADYSDSSDDSWEEEYAKVRDDPRRTSTDFSDAVPLLESSASRVTIRPPLPRRYFSDTDESSADEDIAYVRVPRGKWRMGSGQADFSDSSDQDEFAPVHNDPGNGSSEFSDNESLVGSPTSRVVGQTSFPSAIGNKVVKPYRSESDNSSSLDEGIGNVRTIGGKRPAGIGEKVSGTKVWTGYSSQRKVPGKKRTPPEKVQQEGVVEGVSDGPSYPTVVSSGDKVGKKILLDALENLGNIDGLHGIEKIKLRLKKVGEIEDNGDTEVLDEKEKIETILRNYLDAEEKELRLAKMFSEKFKAWKEASVARKAAKSFKSHLREDLKSVRDRVALLMEQRKVNPKAAEAYDNDPERAKRMKDFRGKLHEVRAKRAAEKAKGTAVRDVTLPGGNIVKEAEIVPLVPELSSSLSQTEEQINGGDEGSLGSTDAVYSGDERDENSSLSSEDENEGGVIIGDGKSSLTPTMTPQGPLVVEDDSPEEKKRKLLDRKLTLDDLIRTKPRHKNNLSWQKERDEIREQLALLLGKSSTPKRSLSTDQRSKTPRQVVRRVGEQSPSSLGRGKSPALPGSSTVATRGGQRTLPGTAAISRATMKEVTQPPSKQRAGTKTPSRGGQKEDSRVVRRTVLAAPPRRVLPPEIESMSLEKVVEELKRLTGLRLIEGGTRRQAEQESTSAEAQLLFISKERIEANAKNLRSLPQDVQKKAQAKLKELDKEEKEQKNLGKLARVKKREANEKIKQLDEKIHLLRIRFARGKLSGIEARRDSAKLNRNLEYGIVMDAWKQFFKAYEIPENDGAAENPQLVEALNNKHFWDAFVKLRDSGHEEQFAIENLSPKKFCDIISPESYSISSNPYIGCAAL